NQGGPGGIGAARRPAQQSRPGRALRGISASFGRGKCRCRSLASGTLAALASLLCRFATTLSFFLLDVDPWRDLSDEPTLVLPEGRRPVVKGQEEAAAVGNVTRQRQAGFLRRNNLPKGFDTLVVHHDLDFFDAFDFQALLQKLGADEASVGTDVNLGA